MHRLEGPPRQTNRRLLIALLPALIGAFLLSTGLTGPCVASKPYLVVPYDPAVARKSASGASELRSEALLKQVTVTASYPLAGYVSVNTKICNPPGADSLYLDTSGITLISAHFGGFSNRMRFGTPVESKESRCMSRSFGINPGDRSFPTPPDDFMVESWRYMILLVLPVISAQSSETTELNYYLFPTGDSARWPVNTYKGTAETWLRDLQRSGGRPYYECTDISFSLAPLADSALRNELEAMIPYTLSVRAASSCLDSINVTVDSVTALLDGTDLPYSFVTEDTANVTIHIGEIQIPANATRIRIRLHVSVMLADGTRPLDGSYWLSQNLMLLPYSAWQQLP